MVLEDANVVETAETSGLIIPVPLLNVLRPHQIAALHFLWRRLVVEGMERVVEMSFSAPLTERVRLSREIFGSIIGHSMGLGKTVTALCFLLLLQRYYQGRALKTGNHLPAASSFNGKDDSGGCPSAALRVIVLTPRSCTCQWQSTIAEWMVPDFFADTHLRVYALLGSSDAREVALNFYQTGGILLLGYEEYQKLLRQARQKEVDLQHRSARVSSIFDNVRMPSQLNGHVSFLGVLESADVVILDESHRLKRLNSRLVGDLMEHMRNVQLRVALTGTPLQNHLEEYNIMYYVVTGRVIDPASFRRLFTLPIERGQSLDSTPQQIMEMQKCVASLRRFFTETIHHCGPEVLERELPTRREYVIFVGLSPSQEEAYRAMLKGHKNSDNPSIIISLHHEASHICFHPKLTMQKARELTHLSNYGPDSTLLLNKDNKRHCAENNSFFKDSVDEDNDKTQLEDAHSPLLPPQPSLLSSQSSQSASSSSLDVMPLLTLGDAGLKWLDIAESPKLVLALSLLQHISEDLKEKVVLFSTYTSHLFLVERLLQQRGITADVLHGGLHVKDRQRVVGQFTNDPSRRVFLCSTKAGGVGINLAAANHCVLLDVSWNPADDTQATYRVYRYGQQRPVTIYRVATEGTFEHVVFFYALRKSWLHKKILGVKDFTRCERHIKENYFIYPCGLPLDFENSDGERKERRDPLPSRNAVQQGWIEYAARSCPALALTAADNTFAWIRSIIEHSFLLRENKEEIISDIDELLDVGQQRAPQPPAIIKNTMTECRSLSDSPVSFIFDSCEPALREYICTCVQHLVTTAQQRLDTVEEDSATAFVTTSETLCRLFEAVIHLEKPDVEMREIVTFLFHRGVDDVMRNTLCRPSYAKLRAFFCSQGGVSDNGTADPLLDSLRYRPCATFSLIPSTEVTYILTEMGICRPFVPHCILRGVWLALRESKASIEEIQRLHSLFSLPTSFNDWLEGDADEGSKRLGVAAVVREEAANALICCIEKLWPPYEGMALPEVPDDLKFKKGFMETVYQNALGRASGLLSTKKAAKLLRLCRVGGRFNSFQCKRCDKGLLPWAPQKGAPLRCGLCHYNAEFDLQTHVDSRHACTLYQFFSLCALLGSFSVLRSLTAPLTPSLCCDVPQVMHHLQHSLAAHAAKVFITNAVSIGIDVLLSGLPDVTVGLVRLQCGEADVAALKRRLAVDSSCVWSVVLRSHVRQLVVDWLLMATGGNNNKAQTTAMPEVILLLALRYLAKTASGSGSVYAKDILLSSTQSREVMMMRFVCDSLVKLIYAERLVETISTLQPLGAFVGRSKTTGQSYCCNSSSESDSDSSDYDSCNNVDTSPLYKSANITAATSRGRARKRRRYSSFSSCSNSFGGSSVSSLSSSFNSCYFNDDNDDDGDSRSHSASGTESAADSAQRRLTESEGTFCQRSALYWAAYCEVYGTRCVELLTVMLEDEENGMTVLPPPSSSLWISEMKTATREGMRLMDVAEEFFARLMALAAGVRVIS